MFLSKTYLLFNILKNLIMKTRIFLLVLVLVSIFALSSCSNEPKPIAPPEKETDAKSIAELVNHLNSIGVKTHILYEDRERKIYIIRTSMSFRETIFLTYDFGEVKYVEMYNAEKDKIRL